MPDVGANPAPYRIERKGLLMQSDPSQPTEAHGVLNPACARGKDGELYIFPRIVDEHNVSRVGKARVLFDNDGNACGVERLGVALEPDVPWESNARSGGCEDPRISFVPALDLYVMIYAAFSPAGPRVALAISENLTSWRRLGPITYSYETDTEVDFNLYPNKDAALFPEPVRAPDGTRSIALLHRPMWDLGWFLRGEREYLPKGVGDFRPSIWVSFVPLGEVHKNIERITHMTQHSLVALPEHDWEHIKIGAGTPPIRVPEGWLTVHHGISIEEAAHPGHRAIMRYCAGVIVLDPHDVRKVIYRSPAPLLRPETFEERNGVVDDVVFPTGIDVRGSGRNARYDLYYGMADSAVGSARLTRVKPVR